MRNNDITITNKKGRKSLVMDQHINFLEKWLGMKVNVGKTFKEAYYKLYKKFPLNC